MTHLVLLPGLDGTGTLHTSFVAAARPAFQQVTVLTYPADIPLSYKALEDRVRESLPTDAPLLLLGESFSGPIAIRIAAHPPPNLVGVVLSTTFACSPLPGLSPIAPLLRFAPVRGVPHALLSWGLLGRGPLRH